MTKNILRLPLNENKRHFVVGDIHGRYDAFESLLNEINYNPNTDMIYSVGDLIDRGPKSYETVLFFKTNGNAYAIMGNHELMCILPALQQIWWNNGAETTIRSLQLNGVDEHWLRDYCSSLPFAIDVGDEDQEGAFRLVHAESPGSWSEDQFYAALTNGDQGCEEILWSRKMIMQGMQNLSGGRPADKNIEFHPDRSKRTVFAGHTPIRKVVKVKDTFFIDTWKGKTLTMMNAVTHEQFVVPVV